MEKNQTQVVIAGAGYAGRLATVRLAGKLRGRPVRITLVNASDRFVERLRLHQFAANRPVRHRAVADILRGTGVSFVHGYANGLDASEGTLEVQTNAGVQRLRYDYLVYALGSTVDRDSVPGVREHAYTLTPFGYRSALELRERLPALNTAGGKLVICGGGATGIEAAAEFAAAYPNLRIQLVTRGSLDGSWGAAIGDYIRTSLRRRGVAIEEHTAVTEVGPTEIRTTAGAAGYDLCLWAGGFVAPPLAREAGLAVNECGQVLIDPYMRSVSHPQILVVGDAAYPVEDPSVKVRMSAFTACILGAHGADSLSAILQGRSPKPLSFKYMGQGIALGPRDAIGFGLYPEDVPKPFYFGGRLAYEIRETFVRYLASAAGIERRLHGSFVWVGKGRYAASRRLGQPQAQVDG